jgi:hypothetical protein
MEGIVQGIGTISSGNNTGEVRWKHHLWEDMLMGLSRATNFYFYPTTKVYLAHMFPNAPREKAGQTSEDSPLIHLGAAVVAGEPNETTRYSGLGS